ncbi:glycosyltransferase [Amycolatopsis umgeniensis]|uniref:Glycosyltransferase involved in cell wall biosynthesis n=1 Tax=Amycolatopsis umgeniensis TaxID=336628 RepID=A0A841BF47_9PSEU|nr:glycosyltransferase [Amycolatopsis umgeniensis]MBB5857415.1 glycosyltransferase involved in cell wall biosynthesis [Amycolatopsis umgeniensis]
MKIAMVSGRASPLAVFDDGPIERRHVHVAELSAALTREGHDVTVYTRRESRRTPATVGSPDGYRVVHVPAGPARKLREDELLPLLGDFTRVLRSRWAKDRPDVVHAHFWSSGLVSLLAAKDLGLPVTQTFHTLGDGHHEDRIRVERMIAKQASRVLAASSDEVLSLVRLGMPRPRASVVSGGVDPAKFTVDGETARRTARYRIVSVGGPGADVVITALASLPETELVLAGNLTTADTRRLRELAERAGVIDRIRTVGWVPRQDLPALLRSADVVVCTPPSDPSVLVPLEAMACGVSVVAASVGVLADTVIDGVTGLLVSPGNSKELAGALRRLLADASAREAFGVAGHDRVRARYSWDRVAADCARAYALASRDMPSHV